MYTDPTRIRGHVVKVRLNDEEAKLIQALTDFTGEQKATLIRDLVLERAMEILDIGGGANESAIRHLGMA